MSKEWMQHIPEFTKKYLATVHEEDFRSGLESSMVELVDWSKTIDKDKEDYAYDKGKWTVKEVVAHINDTERIFQYRSLAFARGDGSSLPGFNQNEYIENAEIKGRSLASLMDEFVSIRKSSMDLFSTMTEKQLRSKGMASGMVVQPILYAYLLSGHLRHHLNVLIERY